VNIWALELAAIIAAVVLGYRALRPFVVWYWRVRQARRRCARRGGYMSVRMPVFDDQLNPRDLLRAHDDLSATEGSES
jgi:ribosomal protein L15E